MAERSPSGAASPPDGSPSGPSQPNTPPKAQILLTILIVGALVSNINLGIANVALPDIGRELQASQVQLNMVASMFTLGLAASVLYLGAVGDRYGRKLVMLSGAALSIPASLLAAFAPNVEVLIAARLLGGLAAGMLFPATLSLISALWRGNAQTKAIALWSGIGGGAAAIGGLVGGALLEVAWWGSVFLLTAPFALLVLIVGFFVVPVHAGEEDTPVDHFGGVISVIAVASLVFGIQQLPQGINAAEISLFVVAAIAFVIFFWRQRRAPHPLIDLKLASAPTFWVAALAGTITFGSMVGVMFLGQQFTQDILGYGTFKAALVTLPTAVMLVVASPIAGRVLISRGSRLTIAIGLFVVACGFLLMVVTWDRDATVLEVLLGYGIVGAGVGFAATPCTHSIMASVPISRAGMGSAFTDLTRDFGGAIIQSLMGTVLAVFYGKYVTDAFNKLTPDQAAQLGDSAAQRILTGYEGAAEVAKEFPQVAADAIVNGAATAFTEGKTAAVLLGFGLTVVAFVLAVWKYPRKAAEQEFLLAIEAASDREQEAGRSTPEAHPA